MSERAALAVSEAQFQAQVLELAKLYGWMAFHVHDSRRSQAGFPDLVLLRGSRLIVVELKTEKGRTSRAQEEWLAAWRTFGAAARWSRVTVAVWRPSDLQAIVGELR